MPLKVGIPVVNAILLAILFATYFGMPDLLLDTLEEIFSSIRGAEVLVENPIFSSLGCDF